MIGIKYNSLNDLNGQALAWNNKVNGKILSTTNEIPFERLKNEGLSPIQREYIIDKINLRRVQKDCLIILADVFCSSRIHRQGCGSHRNGARSLPLRCNMLCAYHDGKQIAVHRISYQKKDMVVNPVHYQKLTIKQSFDIQNTLLDKDNVIDFPMKAVGMTRCSMSEFTYERLRENLERLKLKNTLEILDNYLERALKDNVNIVEILGHIFSEEAKSKNRRAVEKQIQMSGFPMRKGFDDFDFGFQPSIDKRQIDELCTMRFLETAENVVFLGPPGVGKTHLATALGMETASHRFSRYYINCHALIEQLKKAHYENRLPDKLKVLGKYKLLIIDEIGYLPMDIQGANVFFQLIARRYEKNSTIFTSNKTFSQWNEVFADVTIAWLFWIEFCITAP